MKKITLKLSEGVISELRSMQTVKGLSGNLYGVQDEFMSKLLKALEAGDPELVLELKKEREAP